MYFILRKELINCNDKNSYSNEKEKNLEKKKMNSLNFQCDIIRLLTNFFKIGINLNFRYQKKILFTFQRYINWRKLKQISEKCKILIFIKS